MKKYLCIIFSLLKRCTDCFIIFQVVDSVITVRPHHQSMVIGCGLRQQSVKSPECLVLKDLLLGCVRIMEVVGAVLITVNVGEEVVRAIASIHCSCGLLVLNNLIKIIIICWCMILFRSNYHQ